VPHGHAEAGQRPHCRPISCICASRAHGVAAPVQRGSRPTTARTRGSGRLIAEDEEESYDDPDLVAYDSGIDGGGASAEEAAVHVVDEEPGEES
jgi:Family of unknown function (DUF5709)